MAARDETDAPRPRPRHATEKIEREGWQSIGSDEQTIPQTKRSRPEPTCAELIRMVSARFYESC